MPFRSSSLVVRFLRRSEAAGSAQAASVQAVAHAGGRVPPRRRLARRRRLAANVGFHGPSSVAYHLIIVALVFFHAVMEAAFAYKSIIKFSRSFITLPICIICIWWV